MARSTEPISLAGEGMHQGVINAAPQSWLGEIAVQTGGGRVRCGIVEGLARGRDQQEELVWGIGVISSLDVAGSVSRSAELDS
jgi:hypothetical protein